MYKSESSDQQWHIALAISCIYYINMKGVFACAFLVVGFVNAGFIPATTLIRTPAHDSAIIKSDRIGGSFAYSTVEGHAYTAVSPVVQRVVQPVGVSYSAHPVHLGYAHAPIAAPLNYLNYYHQPIVSAPSYIGASSPVLANPIYAGNPVLGVNPIGAGNPIFGGSFAPQGEAPAADAPVAPAQNTPAAPAPGATVDEDTVSVEAA